MILANAWFEWALRGVIWAWMVGGVVRRMDGSADWGRLWPALVGLLVIGMAEWQLRRHRCWVVTGSYDFDALRAFYRADAARRYQALPWQREAFQQGVRVASPPLPTFAPMMATQAVEADSVDGVEEAVEVPVPKLDVKRC